MPKAVSFSRGAAGLLALGLAFVLPAIGVTAAVSDPSGSAGSGASGSNPNPNALWAAQSHGVLKLRAADGSLLLELAEERVRAVATDPRRGTLWTYGRALKSFSPEGGPRTTTALRGEEGEEDGEERGRGHRRHDSGEEDRGRPGEHDREGPGEGALMAVSPGDGGVWVALEEALIRVARDGSVQWRRALEDEAEAVALDPERNRLWVAQEERLAAFGARGERTARIDLEDRGELEAEALSYATELDALWVAGEDTLLRLGPDGTVRYRGEQEETEHLAADHRGGLWLAGERTLRHLDASGLVRLELESFPRSGEIVDLAANPADGSVWAASPQGLARVARSGSVTHREAFRGPGHTGRVWALALFADVTPPTLTFEAPGPDSVHATPTPELRLAHRDLGSGVDTDTLAVTADGEAAAVDCDHGDGTSTCTPRDPLPEGRITLAATVADHAGNTSDPAEVSATLDVTPPDLTVTEPEEGAYTNQTELTLRGTVTDNASGVAALTVAGAAVEPGPDHGFAHTVTLPEDGTHRFDLAATDRAGNEATLTRTVIRDTVPPAAPVTGKIDVEVSDGTATVTGGKGSVEAQATVAVTNNRTGETVRVQVDSEGRFKAEIAAQAGDRLRVQAVDRAGNEGEAAEIATSDIPPDPSDVAPELPATGSPPLAERVSFLYSGSDPIQEGVEPGTIEARRVAVLRGEVRDRSGEPLPGVKITVLDHPEFGRTRTRADGRFDLAVNGGATLTVVYEKDGYLPVQRQVATQWRDWYWAEDVVMTELSGKVTTIDLTDDSQAFQVARGEVTEDADGRRQATLLFPKGTTAEMTLPDGTTERLTRLDVRATEYTVGEDGPDAMPGKLPPASAYTYAVELSVDQVRERGEKVAGKGVRFSQPVPFYVDNFLDFPTGQVVPVGFYNGDAPRWAPYQNGRIVEVLDEIDGRAVLDVTGNGAPATPSDLDKLGITRAERTQLAKLYEPGKSLWRVALKHLSTWDCNYPYVPEKGSESPNMEKGKPKTDKQPPMDCPVEQDKKKGCTISPQRRAVGESLPIRGSNFALNYASHLTPGYRSNRITIPVTDADNPDPLERIELAIEIAGQSRTWIWAPKPNLNHTFIWNGRDGHGRKVHGFAEARITLSYIYPCAYRSGGSAKSNWAGPSFGQAFPPFEVLGNDSRCRGFSFDQTYTVAVASPYKRDAAVAGSWGISGHHAWYPVGNQLVRGDRSQRAPARGLISTAAGTGEFGSSGDGGPATEARLRYPNGAAVMPDGSLLIADRGGNRIRRVGTDGIIETVAGTGARGFSGDGGPATEARLDRPMDVAVGANGAFYIADTPNHRVRKVAPDGTISTVAGSSNQPGYGGDGGDATEARLSKPMGLAFREDGTLFIAEKGNHRVRKVAPDGTITTFAGNGSRARYNRPVGDGGPATEARLDEPAGLAVAANGSLYIADRANMRVRRVAPDGTITTVAGNGKSGYAGDGGPAVDARVNGPEGVALAADGTLYIAEQHNHRIRRVATDGTISTVAGSGPTGPDQGGGYGGDGGPGTEALLNNPSGLALASNGALYVAENWNARVRVVRPRVGEGGRGFSLPSRDGSRVFRFDAQGRHQGTANATTGETRYTFERNSQGRLTTIIDASGNKLRIKRDPDDRATAVIAPNGQRTELTVDEQGHLTGAAGPGGATWSMAYAENGLLTGFTEPDEDQSTFTYDDLGNLTRDAGPEGWLWKIGQTQATDGYRVTMTSGEGRAYRFTTKRPKTGKYTYTTTAPDGTTNRRRHTEGGDAILQRPNGTEIRVAQRAHPQFRLYTPTLKKRRIRLPSGVERVKIANLDVSLGRDGDPLSLQQLTRTVTTNGRTATMTFDADARQWTVTSPEGRGANRTVDGQGRTLRLDANGLAPVNTAYDNRGRPARVTADSGSRTRTTTFAYYGSGVGDQAGYLKSVTDPLGRTVTYTRDAAGRVTGQTLPDGRTIGYRYDPEGELAAVIPPGRSAHVFAYNGRDNRSSYTPPGLAGTATVTRYTYNRDQQLTSVERPGGGVVDIAYDSGGRRSAVTLPEAGTVTYGYNDQTGQLATVTAPGGQSLSLAYDGFLPTRSQWSGTVSGTVSRSYDNNFWVTGRGVNGTRVSFSHDDDGLLTAAGDLSLTRDPDHGLVTATDLAGIAGSRTYNAFGELAQRSVQASGAGLYEAAYTRDKLGRIQSETETVDGAPENWDYTYDEAGRLTRVTRNGALIADYTYDANGNRTAVTTPSGTVTADYDAQDRLTRYGDTTYSYNPAGDLTGKIGPTGTTTYDYDALGNLRHVELPSGKTIDYVIDGANRRIGKKVDGQLVQGFLYKDQLNPIAELDGSGNVEARFVYGAKPNVPATMIKDGTKYRIVSDHLGSVRLVINTATGAVAQRMAYGPFGQVTRDTNPGFQPFGFAGGIYDRDTGLVRFGARDYDPRTGRWTAKDPILFEGGQANLYGYVVNDPVNSLDSNGKELPTAAWCGLAAAVYGSKQLVGSTDQLFESTALLRRQIERVDKRIESCSMSETRKIRKLEKIKTDLQESLYGSVSEYAESNESLSGELKTGILVSGCAVLAAIPGI